MAATHEQGELMLKLYEARRETKMREARQWFFSSFHPATFDDVLKIFMGSGEEGGYIRMVASYWDSLDSMTASEQAVQSVRDAGEPEEHKGDLPVAVENLDDEKRHREQSQHRQDVGRRADLSQVAHRGRDLHGI